LPNDAYEIEVQDMTCRIIYTTTLINSQLKYDMSKLSVGMYFVSVVNDDKKAVLKVVK